MPWVCSCRLGMQCFAARADVAQLVEQRFRKPQVTGSNPVVGSNCLSIRPFLFAFQLLPKGVQFFRGLRRLVILSFRRFGIRRNLRILAKNIPGAL
jgi:hypothetical protein